MEMFTCAPDDQSGPRSAGCLCHTPAFARLNRRLAERFSSPSGASATFSAFAAGSGSASTRASAASDAPIAFTNVRVFDGKSNALRSGLSVVVKGNIIKAVGPAEGALDAHWHAMMAALPMNVLMTADVGYINVVAAIEARKTLMRGFTSVRDMAGPTFGLKRAIDEGIVAGPRIWPSGAMISQTGGHGDFRFPYEIPAASNAPLARADALGAGAI